MLTKHGRLSEKRIMTIEAGHLL